MKDRTMAETNGETNRDGNVKKVAELIKGINIAMLTTQGEEGKLHSRPMQTQDIEFDGTVYFFTYDDSAKAKEIQAHPQVGLSYSNPKNQDYVSVTGRAEISHDKEKMRELWQPPLKAWFPQELDTPGIALIKVEATEAELWDAPSSTVAHVLGLIKSQVTGKPQNVGDNEVLSLPQPH